MDRTLSIEKFIAEFFEERWDNFNAFYKDVGNNKREGIYRLKRGSELMDLLNNISGNVEERLLGKLIPRKFVSVDTLINYLMSFKLQLEEGQKLLDLNKDYEPRYYVDEIQTIKNYLVELIDYLVSSYSIDDTVIPYQDLKQALAKKDLDLFVKIIKSLLASISYPILKKQEGYLHSNIHLLLKLLGFDIISEDNTNLGRIDAVIKFSNYIYIMEFKLGTSQEALDQIKSKKYYEKFIVDKKEIIMVGIGFTPDARNIESHQMEIYK